MADDADAADALNLPSGPGDIAAQPEVDTPAETVDREKSPDGEPCLSAKAAKQRSPVRVAVYFALASCLALVGVVGWLGVKTYQFHQNEQQRALFVSTARQGAMNLTTIDYAHADADLQRILDSATGTFYDDFAKRSKPFIDVVKQAQSKSEGTVTESGMESENADSAQVLVAVSVHTSNAGAQDQNPRAWRMRITVQNVDGGVKIADVEFVP